VLRPIQILDEQTPRFETPVSISGTGYAIPKYQIGTAAAAQDKEFSDVKAQAADRNGPLKTIWELRSLSPK
jgi:hypothetical protein